MALVGRAVVRAAARKLAEGWPVVAERGRRDFGAHMKTTMLARLERMIDSGDKAAHAFAEREVAALTKIRNGTFKSTFNREADTTFTGKHGERSGWAKLSAKAQESYNRPSFFDRLFGRTLPSQHSEKTAYKSD